jgi:hypothetical protein
MKIWIVAGAALMIAGAACAQDAGPGPGPGRGGAVRQACRADIEKLCPGVQPGGGRVMQCMRQHTAEISDPCKSAMMSARGNRRGQQGAPPSDGPPPDSPPSQPQS